MAFTVLKFQSTTQFLSIHAFVLRKNLSCSCHTKTKKTAAGLFKVLQKDLHPSLQSITRVIFFQNIGRVGGAVFYPLISFLFNSAIGLYAPVCVGTHQAAIRYAYRNALETILAGEIVQSEKLNQDILQKIKERKFIRFHVDWRGNVIFHREHSNHFLNLKGLALQPNHLAMTFDKIHQIQEQFLIYTRSQISYYHLDTEIKEQVDHILSARRLRFRACLGTVCAASALGSFYDLLQGSLAPTSLYIAMGCGVGLDHLSHSRVGKETKKLYKLISQKSSLAELIQLKHREKYKELCNQSSKVYLYVSLFGDIGCCEKPGGLNFRETYQFYP